MTQPQIIIQRFSGREARLVNDLMMFGTATLAAFVAKQQDDKESWKEATTLGSEILVHILSEYKPEEIERVVEVVTTSSRLAIKTKGRPNV